MWTFLWQDREGAHQVTGRMEGRNHRDKVAMQEEILEVGPAGAGETAGRQRLDPIGGQLITRRKVSAATPPRQQDRSGGTQFAKNGEENPNVKPRTRPCRVQASVISI